MNEKLKEVFLNAGIVTRQERLTWPVIQEQSLADIIFFN